MTTQADVDAIREALNLKRRGQSVVKVSSGARAVEFDKMTIAELEAALSRAESEVAGRPLRGAIKPYFG